ncbi:MAG: hypothetical protein JJU02_08435 [Cryomorphaceae bacterium]|nr:hypothetical protein [Cryomorphaceae bacterium]
MISIKIEGIFEPEQVRIQKSIDKEGFGRKGLFRADSCFTFSMCLCVKIKSHEVALQRALLPD